MKINKNLVINNFSKNSKNYQENANIQKDASKNLIKLLLDKFNNKFYKTLDLGCGIGFLTQIVKDKSNFDKIINFDISCNMLEINQSINNQNLFVKGDMDFLPFRNDSFDLIFSSFSMQWSQNIDFVINKLSNLLKREGVVAIALPNNESLSRLKAVSKDSGCDFYFKKMPQHKYIAQIMNNCNLQIIKELNVKSYQEFLNPLQAIKSIKKIGANYSNSRKIIKKEKLNKFMNYNNNLEFFLLNWHISYFLAKKNN